ncbi:hypothetical protein FB45DRAFT_783063 [Roridomyces roridus]|uniref:Rhodopsin domain-containing protein n=1 Tax=Roridomyces roridus TaxID=1738132 RepID=A0AAD7G0S5_9AGAR|nr:hypothetical protein FB45DRAFT_783063 [Roridomyces roridus]
MKILSGVSDIRGVLSRHRADVCQDSNLTTISLVFLPPTGCCYYVRPCGHIALYKYRLSFWITRSGLLLKPPFQFKMPGALTLPINELQILTLVLSPIACVITLFRLWVRWARGKLWWDDFWAAFGCLFTIGFIAVFMLHIRDPDTNPMNQLSRVVVYYFCTITFYGVAWTVRISILLTVIRLSFGFLRRVLVYSLAVFFFFWMLLYAQLFWVCVPQPGWKESPLAQCDLGRQVAITLIVTDVIGDAILIAAPLQLLWGARLQRTLKLRLIAVFASTSALTAVSLYHDYTIFLFGGLPEAFAANLQVAVGLMVANLSVISTFLFRLSGESTSTTGNTKGSSSLVTFGRATPRRVQATTFGGFDTMIMDDIDDQQPIKVQVNISRTDHLDPIRSHWMDNKHDEEQGKGEDKIELHHLGPV